jgi:hypothetical protein
VQTSLRTLKKQRLDVLERLRTPTDVMTSCQARIRYHLCMSHVLFYIVQNSFRKAWGIRFSAECKSLREFRVDLTYLYIPHIKLTNVSLYVHTLTRASFRVTEETISALCCWWDTKEQSTHALFTFRCK